MIKTIYGKKDEYANLYYFDIEKDTKKYKYINTKNTVIKFECIAIGKDDEIIDKQENIEIREEAPNLLINNICIKLDGHTILFEDNINVSKHVKDRYINRNKHTNNNLYRIGNDSELVVKASDYDYNKKYKYTNITNGSIFTLHRKLDDVEFFDHNHRYIPTHIKIEIFIGICKNLSSLFITNNKKLHPKLRILKSYIECEIINPVVEPSTSDILQFDTVYWKTEPIGFININDNKFSTEVTLKKSNVDLMCFIMFTSEFFDPTMDNENLSTSDDNPYTSCWNDLDRFHLSYPNVLQPILSLTSVYYRSPVLYDYYWKKGFDEYFTGFPSVDYLKPDKSLFTSEKGIGAIFVFPEEIRKDTKIKVYMEFKSLAKKKTYIYLTYRGINRHVINSKDGKILRDDDISDNINVKSYSDRIKNTYKKCKVSVDVDHNICNDDIGINRFVTNVDDRNISRVNYISDNIKEKSYSDTAGKKTYKKNKIGSNSDNGFCNDYYCINDDYDNDYDDDYDDEYHTDISID